METKVRKAVDFTGKDIYVGMDVHNKSWTITILSKLFEHKTFTQPPEPDTLCKYLSKNFPGANYHCVYEAGFCGFWIYRKLVEKGIGCMVVNPADVPTTDKEKKTRRDPVDSRKLARSLRSGMLEGINIPDRQLQEDRTLVRQRKKILRDLNRIKNRIKSLLKFYGINIPPQYDKSYWSANFIKWLQAIEMEEGSGQQALNLLLEELLFWKDHLLKANQIVRELMNSDRYKENAKIMLSVPGLGPLTTMIFLTEIGDVKRFPRTNHLCSMIGLVPSTDSSGETEKIGSLTSRHSNYLRDIFVEAAWIVVRQDPAMTCYYEELVKRMPGQKAIIRVARKLINRIRYLLINRQEYVPAVAA